MSDIAATSGPPAASRFQSALSLIARLAAGQVFIFAGLNKVADPQGFADAIIGFDLVSNETLVMLAAFVIPWLELLAGLMLVAGLWTRASAAVILILLAAFAGAIWSAMDRGLSLDCGCFGDLKLFCEGELGNCNLIQNGVLAAFTLMAIVVGGGRASADALLHRSGPVAAEDAEIEFD